MLFTSKKSRDYPNNRGRNRSSTNINTTKFKERAPPGTQRVQRIKQRNKVANKKNNGREIFTPLEKYMQYIHQHNHASNVWAYLQHMQKYQSPTSIEEIRKNETDMQVRTANINIIPSNIRRHRERKTWKLTFYE